MTPKDRLLNAIRGKHVDRVPAVLEGLMLPSRNDIDALVDPACRTLAHRVFSETAYALPVPSCVNRYLVTPPPRMQTTPRALPSGATRTVTVIDTPRGELTAIAEDDRHANTTWQVKYPVENRADIEKIMSVPWERAAQLAPPDPAALPADPEGRAVVTTRISTPMVCVAGMMSYQYFLELALTEPSLVSDLTEICLERIMDTLSVLLSRPGIEYVWIGGSEWLTPPMGSPAMYDALVQEQERQIIEFVKHTSDAVVHIHCHGRARHSLLRCIERGADYTEPVEPPPDGDITMAEAKELSGGRISLGGNVEARILFGESEETVETAVRAAFEGGKQRFVFSTTARPTPAMTERESRNYTRMIDVWEELSPI